MTLTLLGRVGSRLLITGKGLIVGLALLGLAGCAGLGKPGVESDDPDTGYSQRVAYQLFDDVYTAVQTNYVDPVKVGGLALDGLGALGKLDETMAVTSSGDQLVLAQASVPLASVAPPGADDPAGWSRVSVRFVTAARQASPTLKALPAEKINTAIITTALADLDRNTRYHPATNAADIRAQRDGFGGIGISLSADKPQLIAQVLPNLPAAKAGLKLGDKIIAVDGKPTEGLSNRAMVDLLRGPIDTEVRIQVARGEGEVIAVVIIRSFIVEQTVRYRREPGNVAYIHLSGFNIQTAATLSETIRRARREIGPEARGLILDLRNNPGGLLDQGVTVADIFLSGGRILTTKGQNPASIQRFDATGVDITDGLPIVVLVNGRSASSSEIVASALQDTGRAALVGSESYGKGTVQRVYELRNAGELDLTWARFYAPSGYSLHRFGVMPDVCTSGVTVGAARALEGLRGGQVDLPRLLVTRRGADSLSPAEQTALTQLCPPETTKPDPAIDPLAADHEADIDVQVALKMLAEPALYQRATRGAVMTAAN